MTLYLLNYALMKRHDYDITSSLRRGALHVIKELKQGSEKDNPKTSKKEKTSRKDKPLAILMVQPWLRLEVKSQMIPATAPLIGFSGEIIWPMGQILLPVKIGDAEHFTYTWMNFVAAEERIKVAIHPEHPKQTIAIGSTLTEEGWKALCDLLRRNLDVFSWKPTDMTGVLRHIAKHRLNVHEGCLPIRQKKKSQAPERNKAIQEEVEKLVDAGLMKEVHYHSWLLNPDAESAVLMKKREAKQMSIYFVSHALQGPEIKYTSVEKLVLALEHARKWLKRYFQAHTIIVIMDQPIKQIPSRPKVAGRMQKWSIELDGPLDTPMEEEEELSNPWTLFKDGSSWVDGFEAGLILTNPKGAKFTYALRFRFDATNNEAEFEALIAGLRIAEQMGVKNLQTNVDSRLVAKQVPRSENKKADALSKIASTNFAHLNKQVLIEELKEKYINEAEALTFVKEERDTWMAIIYNYLTEGTLPTKKGKARAVPYSMHAGTRSVVARGHTDMILLTNNARGCKKIDKGMFGFPGEIISDNEKQFRDNPFKDWCKKLCIHQCFASVKHPQANGLVERANRSLREGIKARLDERSKDLIEELPHVLWAHHIMIKSSNGDTPFSLTYRTKAVISAEIGMPTIRKSEVDIVQNDEALEINLDLLKERREQA
nr:reverse transcriptase domain-containing protein [Tanacetum cinerariifolium]